MPKSKFTFSGPIAIVLALSACNPGNGEGTSVVTAGEAETFDAIGPEETIKFAGTEPFWGGEVAANTLRYSTPENIDGVEISVERFAGNNGLGYSGELDGAPFDLAITPGECSDGMSDRTYPYHATLQLGEASNEGCAWTDGQPFSEAEAP